MVVDFHAFYLEVTNFGSFHSFLSVTQGGLNALIQPSDAIAYLCYSSCLNQHLDHANHYALRFSEQSATDDRAEALPPTPEIAARVAKLMDLNFS